MVRSRVDVVNGKQRLEVLEGLSSNFFVVDRNGSLRTATQGVLNGYVRHLVMESASECGIPFGPRPIYLHQAHEWTEAFITSSSRLIYPISKVLLPEGHRYSDSNSDDIANSSSSIFVEYWSDPYFDAIGNVTRDERDVPTWQLLLNEILKVQGYS